MDKVKAWEKLVRESSVPPLCGSQGPVLQQTKFEKVQNLFDIIFGDDDECDLAGSEETERNNERDSGQTTKDTGAIRR